MSQEVPPLELEISEVLEHLQKLFDSHEQHDWCIDNTYMSFVTLSHEYIRYLKQNFWTSDNNVAIIKEAEYFLYSLLGSAFYKHFINFYGNN